MKIISWNVAGFRACLKKGFDEFFKEIDADVFCIQESKVMEDQFDYHPEGYYRYLNPAERKGYSGTLVYTKIKPLNVTYGMEIDEHDHEGRVITMEFEKYYVITVYVPNVKRDLSRLEYRMKWEDDFRTYLKNLEKSKPVVVCGDLNVERGKFTELLESGFIDTFRYFHPDEEKYSWWSYMGQARSKNIGWRIDYFVVSDELEDKISEANIYDEVLGSDHCPVELVIED